VLGVLEHKFGREERALRDLLDELLVGAVRIETCGSITGACRDPHDGRILETAVAANAELLVAGDKDLRAMQAFQEISIITPADYISRAL
jgi:predicted nucleic acid-binding protein